jgi:UV DNA damage endonuclease
MSSQSIRQSETQNNCQYSQYKHRICLGLCCINTELRERRKFPVFNSRTCIRKNFTVEKAKELALQNVRDLPEMMTWNYENNINCFRLSSDMFPHFTDTETEKYTINFAQEDLILAGGLAKAFNQRILMHPGQYNQIGTPNKQTFEKTIEDLQHHANILDTMNIDNNGVIIVHGGGTYGDIENTKRRWIEQFDDLPTSVKNRLVIENCERQYSTRDCLDISEQCNIPVVFDFHHYECYNIINKNKKIQEEIMDIIPEVIETWEKTNRYRLIMHVSEQGTGKIGHHSDYVEKIPNEIFTILDEFPSINIDLEVEAKMKEKAIIKLYNKYKGLF